MLRPFAPSVRRVALADSKVALTRRVAIVALSALVVSACSFTTMQRPPSDYQPQQHGAPACSDGKSRPVVDGLGAVAGVGVGIIGLGVRGLNPEAASSSFRRAGTAVAVSSFAISAALVTSALYGNHTANRCRSAEGAYELYLEEHPGRGGNPSDER